MKRQTSWTDERIDKHIEAQTDRQVCRREEFIVCWVPYDRYGIRAYRTVIVYEYTVQVGNVEKDRKGSEVRTVKTNNGSV
jgi:hypothetical protein